MAAGQKVTSDDIAVENMLAPSCTQLPQVSTNNSLLNPAQPSEAINQTVQPILASTEQSLAVSNTCPSEIQASSVRPDDRTSLLPMDESITSNAQRAILSNIQNTGQPQQPVQKPTGKVISHRNDIPDVCAQATNSVSLQDISSVLQNQLSQLNTASMAIANQGSLLLGSSHSSHITSGENQVQNQPILGNYYNTLNDSDHVQDDRNHVQTKRGHVQSATDHVQGDINLVPNDNEHVQNDQDHVKSGIDHVQSDGNHVQTHPTGGNFGLVTNTAHVNRTQTHVQSILGISNPTQVNVTSSQNFNRGKTHMQGRSAFVSSVNESRNNLTSHVNRGKSHVLSSSTFAASINESRRNTTSQTNSHVNSTNIPRQDHVVDSNTSNDSSSINNPIENTSIKERPFNLIEFISNNSSERTCDALSTDVSTTRETTADILANKTAQDGQTALLENIMGFTETNPESLTLPLTPKGSCGSGYGLGLDVDEFLNSEDGQRMYV